MMRGRHVYCTVLVAAGLLLMLDGAGNPASATARPASQAPLAATNSNVRASHDRFPDHAEPALAVNPRDPANLFGAAMYFRGSPTPGTFASFDGGRTWRDNGALPLPPGFSGGGDVSAAFDSHGVGYIAAETATANPNGRGVYVWRTDDGGRHFRHHVAVVSGQFVDHPWLAVDTTPGPVGDDLYVAWATRHAVGSATREGVAFSRSVDGGHGFAPPRIISAPPGGVTAPVVAAGPGGAVYVAFVTVTSGSAVPHDRARVRAERAGRVRPRARDATPKPVVVVVASADHGRHIGPPVTLGPAVFGLTPQPGLLLPTGPMVATDHRDGTVYVAYTAMHPRSGQPGVVLARSRDGGRTWTTPAPIAVAPPRDHVVVFQPRVAVDAAGTVAVSYLLLARDRVDVLLARSVTHGARFGPPRQVTTRSFDPALGLPGDKEGLWWIGDYQALAAGPGIMHPCWGDTRTGHLEIFTAAVPIA